MTQRSKAYRPPLEAIRLAQKTSPAKFDATVEVAIRLGVDPRKADQMVRGTVNLPHGTGKTARVVVFAVGDRANEAIEADADEVGGDELIEKVAAGYTDFDAAVATPDLMAKVGRLGRVLGPRGLMPNPKTGTVTMEVGKAIKEVKAGKIDFKVDKFGIIHASVAKVSFSPEAIAENAKELLDTIVKLKPQATKGTYVKSVYISSTMSRGLAIDPKTISDAS